MSAFNTFTERVKDAFLTLRGLKRATSDPRRGADITRIGQPPEQAPEDYNTVSASWEFFRNYTHLEPDRISVYNDMDEMFTHVLAASALEAYIEEASQEDPIKKRALWIESKNPTVRAQLERLLDTLEIEDRVFGDMWTLGKYGDLFGLVMPDLDKGVFDIIPLEPRIVWRHESQTRVLTGFSIGDSPAETEAQKTAKPGYLPWDIVHWRIRGKRIADPYGTPLFFSLRLIYKVLKLMEEQMAIYRMNMHPDRLVFSIYTGNAGPDERLRMTRLWRKEMEKNLAIDRDTGRFTAEYAPWQINQNIYWPKGANDTASGVEKFEGSSNVGDIYDIAYMRDLFFAGTRIPKAYMGFEDSQGYRGTETLSMQSVKFARTVKRLRKHYLNGLVYLCKIHLALRGIDPQLPESEFSLHMVPLNYLDDVAKAEATAKRVEAVKYLIDAGQQISTILPINMNVWLFYVLKEYAGFEDEFINKLLTPAPSSPTITYQPTASKLIFERLSVEDKAALEIFLAQHPEIDGLLEGLSKSEDDGSCVGSKNVKFQKFDNSKRTPEGKLVEAVDVSNRRTQERTRAAAEIARGKEGGSQSSV